MCRILNELKNYIINKVSLYLVTSGCGLDRTLFIEDPLRANNKQIEILISNNYSFKLILECSEFDLNNLQSKADTIEPIPKGLLLTIFVFTVVLSINKENVLSDIVYKILSDIVYLIRNITLRESDINKYEMELMEWRTHDIEVLNTVREELNKRVSQSTCQHLNINGKFSKVINIICSATDSNLQICNDINIIRITISNEFTLEFDGYMTCKNMYIDVSNANIVNINTIINNENSSNVVLSNDKLIGKKRERLSLLLKSLELRSNEGINDQASHNALGKIYISMNKNNTIHFLETNIFYNIEIIIQSVDNNVIKMNKLNGLLNQFTQYLKQDKLYNLQLAWLSTISLISDANKSCAKDNIELQFNEQRILMNELKNEINDKQNTIGILIYKSNNICKPKYNKTIKNLKYENNILFKERDDALNEQLLYTYRSKGIDIDVACNKPNKLLYYIGIQFIKSFLVLNVLISSSINILLMINKIIECDKYKLLFVSLYFREYKLIFMHITDTYIICDIYEQCNVINTSKLLNNRIPEIIQIINNDNDLAVQQVCFYCLGSIVNKCKNNTINYIIKILTLCMQCIIKNDKIAIQSCFAKVFDTIIKIKDELLLLRRLSNGNNKCLMGTIEIVYQIMDKCTETQRLLNNDSNSSALSKVYHSSHFLSNMCDLIIFVAKKAPTNVLSGYVTSEHRSKYETALLESTNTASNFKSIGCNDIYERLFNFGCYSPIKRICTTNGKEGYLHRNEKEFLDYVVNTLVVASTNALLMMNSINVILNIMLCNNNEHKCNEMQLYLKDITELICRRIRFVIILLSIIVIEIYNLMSLKCIMHVSPILFNDVIVNDAARVFKIFVTVVLVFLFVNMHVMFILFNDGTRPLQLLWFLLTIKDDSIEIIHYILSVAIYCIREMGLYINYILYELNVLYELLIPY